MPLPPDELLGTRDLEKGMRASPASTFRTIAVNALILRLLFNSAGLGQWAQRLPSTPVNAWLAERRRLGPDDARRRRTCSSLGEFLKAEGP